MTELHGEAQGRVGHTRPALQVALQPAQNLQQEVVR
jgi:hypothetical protein